MVVKKAKKTLNVRHGMIVPLLFFLLNCKSKTDTEKKNASFYLFLKNCAKAFVESSVSLLDEFFRRGEEKEERDSSRIPVGFIRIVSLFLTFPGFSGGGGAGEASSSRDLIDFFMISLHFLTLLCLCRWRLRVEKGCRGGRINLRP